MQIVILTLFALCFATGLYLILAEVIGIPTYRATRAVMGRVKKSRSRTMGAEAMMMEAAVKLSHYLRLDEYKKRKMDAMLKSAEIPLTAEVYQAQAIVRAGVVLVFAMPCLFAAPLLSPAFVIGGIAVYFRESQAADRKVQERRTEIEQELPRFVLTLTQELKASRDVLSILETYRNHAGAALQNELAITVADMRTGNYESALTRLEARVSSAMLSDVVRGLVGVLRGDDGVTFFAMLSHDMKQIEFQRLKKLALERPPKIRKYSFLLLGCMIVLYICVMGYQIVGTMSGMF
ncbi:MAG: secretion protein F [Lachnospiraceae bacterium]